MSSPTEDVKNIKVAAESGVGKGTLALSSSVKRELNNEIGASKKRKTDDEWVNVGRMGFYLEIPKSGSTKNLIQELKPHAGKILSVKPHDDSYNPMAVRVGIPGRTHTTIWKYGGDAFINRFLYYGVASQDSHTRCNASIPDDVEVLDDPKRKTWWLVPVDVHFYLHKEINLFEHPDSNVKRQIKQLVNYLRGGTQPNPPVHAWPIVRSEIEGECKKTADMVDRLMKKRTAKDWWKEPVKK